MSLKSVTVTTRSEKRENQSFRPSFSGSTYFCTYKDAKIVYMEPGCTWDKVYELIKEEINEFPAEKNKQKLPSQTWFYEKIKEIFHVKTHQSSKA